MPGAVKLAAAVLLLVAAQCDRRCRRAAVLAEVLGELENLGTASAEMVVVAEDGVAATVEVVAAVLLLAVEVVRDVAAQCFLLC